MAIRMTGTGEGRLDTSSPMLTLQATDGSRVVMVLGGRDEHGISTHPRIAIRRFVVRQVGLDGLADIAERHASQEMRTTRDQNIALLGIDPSVVTEAVAAIEALGLPIEHNVGDVPDVAACPGTTT